MVSLAQSATHPLLVIGNFDGVISSHKKTGRPPIHISCEDFREIVDTCSLLELEAKGSYYIWSNGRGTCAHVECCLDRALFFF